MIVILIEPQIPQNTGNIGRLCAATNTPLHIVGKIGFTLDDKHLKRAGLDYWAFLKWTYFPNTEQYIDSLPKTNSHLLTTKSTQNYTQQHYTDQSMLIFGSETTGVSDNIRKKSHKQSCRIPMPNNNVRSLNLSNAVSIVLYEAIRQVNN